MAEACRELGSFGARLKVARKVKVMAKKCKSGRHLMVGENLGIAIDAVFCRACHRVARMRHYYARQLRIYWTRLDLPIVTEAEVSALPIEDGRAAPTGLGKEANATASVTPVGDRPTQV